jgi:hypothetical protein
MMRSVVVGTIVSALFAISAFFVFPRTVVTTAFLFPGALLAGAFGGHLPNGVIYALSSEGGAPAFLILALIGSLLSWIFIFSVVFLVSRKLVASGRPNQALQPTAGRSDE